MSYLYLVLLFTDLRITISFTIADCQMRMVMGGNNPVVKLTVQYDLNLWFNIPDLEFHSLPNTILKLSNAYENYIFLKIFYCFKNSENFTNNLQSRISHLLEYKDFVISYYNSLLPLTKSSESYYYLTSRLI